MPQSWRAYQHKAHGRLDLAVIQSGPMMETPEEIRSRWSYLRDLLLQQLERFESGALQVHSHDEDVSPAAIVTLKQNILDFDQMIARSLAREQQDPPEG